MFRSFFFTVFDGVWNCHDVFIIALHFKQSASDPLYCLFIAGRGEAGENPCWVWAQGGVYAGQVIQPRVNPMKQTTTHTHIHTYGQFEVASWPDLFGLWEETGVYLKRMGAT